MNMKLFRKLSTAGVFVVFAVASFLHFLYDLTGGTVLGALFGAVNESTWEHLKIFAIAYIFWALVELVWAKPPFRCFVVAKTLGVYSLISAITAFFYLYTSIVGRSYTAVDIGMAFVFTALAQLFSCFLMGNCEKLKPFFYTAVMFLALLFSAILCFSYYPPEVFLFRDPITGAYGIVSCPECCAW